MPMERSFYCQNSSEAPSSDAQGNHFGPTIVRRATMVIWDHKRQREPDPSNQVGPACASKDLRDHGPGGRFWRYTSYIKILDFLCFLLQTVTTFDPNQSLKGDRLDQTFNANYIKATLGLCNLHLLCNRGPNHEIISRRADRVNL